MADPKKKMEDSVASTWRLLYEILVCPACHGSLSSGKDAFECPSCKLTFPILAGVPDFRVVSKDFKASEQEIRVRDALLSAYEKASFKDLINIRFMQSKRLSRNLWACQKRLEMSYREKGANRHFQIKKLIKDNARDFPGKGLFLDIGCGSGTAVPWIMEDFERGIGIDYSIVDLIVGSKFLEERRVTNLNRSSCLLKNNRVISAS